MPAKPSALESSRFALGDTLIDLVALRVERGSMTESLTPLEGDLLGYLLSHLDQVVSRDELLREVWRYAPGLVSRAVDNTVRRLRRKIEADDAEPVYLQSVYGQGYLLTGAQEASAAVLLEPALRNIWPAVSSFVGRRSELEAVAHLLASSRLVTIVGAAGSGKTRLAREHAIEACAHYPGGIWEVPLADASPDQVSAIIIRSLGTHSDAGADDVVTAIRRRGQVLVLLDNLEHLIEIAVTLAGWIARAPSARFLVTSRVPLRIDGELLLELAPLSDGESLELITDRALAVGHKVDPVEHAALLRIARRLDGLPLSLELAAARLRSVSVDALETRLERGLQVLSGQRRDVPARHISLQAAIIWSWDLLDDATKGALTALTVFRGGCELEAFEEVSGDPDAADHVAALHEHSLIRIERAKGAVRYLPYETVRTFVAARADPDHIHAQERHHAEYYARWGASSAAAYERDENQARRDALVAEIDNLLAAHQRLLGMDPDLAVGAAIALAVALESRGPLSAAEAVLTASLDSHVSASNRIRLCLYRGEIRTMTASQGSLADLEIAAVASDGVLRARALRAIGLLRWRDGTPLEELLVGLKTALHSAVEANAPHLVARILLHVGMVETQLGRPHELEAAAAQSMTIARSLGNREAELRAATILAFMHAKEGAFDKALADLTPFLASGRAIPSLMRNLATVSALAERYDEAKTWIDEAIRASERLGSIDDLIGSFETLAMIYQQLGRLDDATEVLDRLLALDGLTNAHNATLAAVQGQIALERGQLDSAEQSIKLALALGPKPWMAARLGADLGDIAWCRGDLGGAAAAYERAVDKLDQIGNTSDAAEIRFCWAGVAASSDLSVSRALREAALAALLKPSFAVNADLVVGLECVARAQTDVGRTDAEVDALLRRAKERLANVPPSPPWRVRFL